MTLIDCMGQEINPGDFVVRSTEYGYFVKRYEGLTPSGYQGYFTYVVANIHNGKDAGVRSERQRHKITNLIKFNPTREWLDIWNKVFDLLSLSSRSSERIKDVDSKDIPIYQTLYRLKESYIK
jgi:hypothetical protein